MFPGRNDPCRPSSWEDPDDDYDPGHDLYDDEVMTAETRIYQEMKAEPDCVDMSDGELSELAREYALEEVGDYDKWLAQIKLMNEEP